MVASSAWARDDLLTRLTVDETQRLSPVSLNVSSETSISLNVSDERRHFSDEP